ncbi:MAG: aryl-sulfate sulfotransferase [Ignavibacteriaceae bacterium]
MSLADRLFSMTIVMFVLSVLITFSTTSAQNINNKQFQYISPMPSSKLNSTGTNIIIRYGNAFNNSLLNDSSVFYVSGSKSGHHLGKTILAEKGKTLIFKPVEPFSDGEIVLVKLSGDLTTVAGEKIPGLQFYFETSKVNLNEEIRSNPEKYSYLLDSDYSAAGSDKKFNLPQKVTEQKAYTLQKDSLPEDYPDISVSTVNNPAPGELFFTPFDVNGKSPSYLIITDNYGIPIFYKKMPHRTYNLALQPTGFLTYYETVADQHYVMDSSYNVIDSLHMQNGYTTNVHELTILKNGHALLMCYDEQKIAMDTIVKGGNPNAAVRGVVIQELDTEKNVVFQWRSWDHFKITDVTPDISLTDSIIDYVHCNSIEMDTDTNIIISSRNLDEITKIDRETGDIIWRLGGEYCKNNEFTFIEDPVGGFSHQHDARRLPNGDLSLFDNGNLHDPKFSRAVEYKLDEINKTATLVWEHRNSRSTFSQAMGSMQRLDNQNVIIGWGWTNVPPAITEVKDDGTLTFYMQWSNNMVNYRVYKYPWKTNIFTTRPDSLSFGYVPLGDSLIQSFAVVNNSDQEIEINGLLNRDSSYQVNDSLPILIAAKDSAVLDVKFKPDAGPNHPDVLYIQWNKKDERVARMVKLTGTTDSVATDVKINQKKLEFSLAQSYPNPFNPSTKIRFTIPNEGKVTLKVYDILGHEIRTLINSDLKPGNYHINFNAEDLPSGVYLYNLRVNDYNVTKKMLLIK